MGHWMLPIAFFPDWPSLPWQQNLRQNWLLLSLCKRYKRDFCICRGVFGNGTSNAANRILSRPTFVAMATKFMTKWAIPRLVQQISPRSLHLTEVRVEGLAIRWHQAKSTGIQPWFFRYNEQQRSRSSSSSRHIQRSVPDQRYAALPLKGKNTGFAIALLSLHASGSFPDLWQ